MRLVNTLVGCAVFLGFASIIANVITFYLLEDSDLYYETRVDTARRLGENERQLAEGERLMIERIFRNVDSDNDGKVSELEFKTGVETLLGRRLPEWEARNLFRKLGGGRPCFCCVLPGAGRLEDGDEANCCSASSPLVTLQNFILWWKRKTLILCNCSVSEICFFTPSLGWPGTHDISKFELSGGRHTHTHTHTHTHLAVPILSNYF